MANIQGKLSKDDKTIYIIDNLTNHYEIYGIEESGELCVYLYPTFDIKEDDAIGFKDGDLVIDRENGDKNTYELGGKYGVFLRGNKGLKRISKIIHEVFDDLFPGTILNRSWEADILNLLKYKRTVSIKAFDKGSKETLLFKNGKLKVTFPLNDVLLPYYPPNNTAYKSFQQLPIKFDSNAECPKIDKFLEETFGEENLYFIYQVIGYLMSRSIHEQKAFVIYGEASTGKTTFLELLTRFIGKDLISNISLHGLGERFAMSRTRDKRVNIYDDLSFAKIYNTSYSNFKQLVSNKSLSGEIKQKQALAEWDNTCKCVFGCNQLPFVPYYADTDFFRRLILIPCRNKVQNKNKNILAELTTEAELSGLLNRALKGLEMLFGNGGFPVEWDDIERVRSIWELNSKPTKMFIEEHCVFGKDNYIDVDQFNKSLRVFRRDNNAIKVTDRQIATSLRTYKDTIKTKRIQENNVKYRIYEGFDIDVDSPYYEYKNIILELTPTTTGQINLDKILGGAGVMDNLDWLEAKDTEYLLVHRHELKVKIKTLQIGVMKKQNKLDRIDEILETRKYTNIRVLGSG